MQELATNMDRNATIEQRSKRLFSEQQSVVNRGTDRMLASIMALQWIGSFMAAIWLSPSAAEGPADLITNNYWAAVAIGALITLLAIWLGFWRAGMPSTRFAIAVSQMLIVALLSYAAGDKFGTSYHILLSLAFLSLYRDWRIVLLATAIVVVDHMVQAAFWPQLIYGTGTTSALRWFEHVSWVLFVDIFLLIVMRRNIAAMWNIAKQTAEVWYLNDELEERVRSRTTELAVSKESLEAEVANRTRLQTESEAVGEIAYILNSMNLENCPAYIHRIISELISAENLSIAVCDEESGILKMIYYADQREPVAHADCLRNGLPAFIMQNRKTMQFTKRQIAKLTRTGKISIEDTLPEHWLGVPIKSLEKFVGVLSVKYYNDIHTIEDCDIRFLESVAAELARGLEHSQVERIRRQNEERFRDLFENAPIAYHELDKDGRYVRLNTTEEVLLGYMSEELCGRHVSEFVVEPEAKGLTAESLAKQGSNKSVERTFIRRDGTWVPVLNEDRLIFDSEGNISGIRSTLQDITERKLLEEKARQGQRLESIGHLAAGIAHEINTPTQYVSDNVRFLEQSFADIREVFDRTDEVIRSCRSEGVVDKPVTNLEEAIEKADIGFLNDEIPYAIQQTLNGIERITKVVHSMSDFANSGMSEIRAADLNKALESTITVSSAEWKYVANVETDFDGDLPAVDCRVGEINQVVLNMIVNAAESIADVVGINDGRKGKITVSTRRNGTMAEIRVSDTGMGIPKNLTAKIFDPFFTTKDVGNGTGQGLSIARTIVVEKHHGTIDVESEFGKGSTFIVNIPIDGDAQSTESTDGHFRHSDLHSDNTIQSVPARK